MSMPPELHSLFERYNALGRLLPSEDDVAFEPDARARAQVVLAEMQATKRMIDNFLAASAKARELHDIT
jgi:hypothetical protein